MSRLAVLAVLMVGVVAGCGPQGGAPGKPVVSQTQPVNAETPPALTGPHLDLRTRDDLRLFGLLLDHHDVLRARIVGDRLMGRIPAGNKTFVERLSQLDRQLNEQDVEVGKGYLWARKPWTDSPQWREAIATAEGYLKRFGGGRSPRPVGNNGSAKPRDYSSPPGERAGTGAAIFRIRLEDLDREDRVGVFFPGLANLARWGSNNSFMDLSSGEFLLLGRDGLSQGAGQIEIDTLRHACPKLAVETPESGVVCAGDLLIRVAPSEDQGAIQVRVLPEPGLPLDNAEVFVGRRLSLLGSSYPLRPDGTCLIEGVAAGPCEPHAWASGVFCSQYHRVQVTAGQTTEVELPAYAYRRVVVEWKYRRLGVEDGWHAGTTTARTGEHESRTLFELDGKNDSAFGLSEWSDAGATIGDGVGWHMLPAEPGDFDPPQVRPSKEQFRQARSEQFPIKVGKVFAMYRLDPSTRDETEAVIRIHTIEPMVPLTSGAGAPGSRPAGLGTPAASQVQAVVAQTRPAGGVASMDLQARDDLRLLGQLLERHDAMRARILAERLLGPRTEGDEAFARHLDELDRQLADQEVEVGNGYLWAHKLPEDDPRVQRTMRAMQQRLKWYPRGTRKGGIVGLSIQFEDQDREMGVGMLAQGLSAELMSGGNSSWSELCGGQPIILTKGYGEGPFSGSIEIEALRHVCTRLPIDLPESGMAYAGELLIRTVPSEQQGRIRVRVVPEAGVSLVGGKLHIGRHSPSPNRGFPLQPDGTCVIDGVGPGAYGVYAGAPKLFRTLYRRVQVVAGQTREVDLQAYACRRVVIDWKYRRLGDDGPWHEGADTVLTGEMSPADRWGVRGCRYDLSNWDGAGTSIHGLSYGRGDGRMVPATQADFDSPRVRESTADDRNDGGRQSYPVTVGSVFALRYGQVSSGEAGEAVIRIRSIEPAVPLATQPTR